MHTAGIIAGITSLISLEGMAQAVSAAWPYLLVLSAVVIGGSIAAFRAKITTALFLRIPR